MNKIFKVIWSKSKQCYVVVSEIAKNTTGKKKIVVASILATIAMQTVSITNVQAINDTGTGTQGSVAIGYNSQAKGTTIGGVVNPSVAVGTGAYAEGNSALALGTRSWAKGSYNVSVGRESTSSQDYGIAIGYQANVSAIHGMALGERAAASGQIAVAVGANAKATGTNSFAGGFNSASGGTSSVALGESATSSGETSVAIGKNTVASDGDAVSIGTSSQATGADSVALGKNAKASNGDTIAIGQDSVADLLNGVALGKTSKATGASATALGPQSTASATYAAAIGMNSVANQEYATAIGGSSQATVQRGVALGAYSIANTASGVAGYNVNANRTNKYTGLAGNTLTSTWGAVSIGDSTNTRQITGLAAGTKDTDAVNVAQLKSVNLAFTGDNSSKGDVNLADSKLAVTGDTTYITTDAAGQGIAIKGVKKDITVSNGTASASAGMADAKNVAEAINQANADQKISYKANGTNINSVKLSDGLNFTNGTSTVATVANNGQVTYDLNTATKKSITDSEAAVKRTISLGADSGTRSSQSLNSNNVEFNVKGNTGSYITTAMVGNTLTVNTTRGTIQSDTSGTASLSGGDGLATAQNVATAINKAREGAAWDLAVNSGAAQKVSGGNKVTFKNGKNISLTQSGTTITVGTTDQITADNVTVGTGANQIALNGTNGEVSGKSIKVGNTTMNTSGLTISGGPSVTTTGINAGNKAITSVGSGLGNDSNAATVGDVKSLVNGLGSNSFKLTADSTSTTAQALNKSGGLSFKVAGDSDLISTSATGDTVKVSISKGSLTNNTDGTVNANKVGVATTGDVATAVNNAVAKATGAQGLTITDGTHNGKINLKTQSLAITGTNGVDATVNNQNLIVGLNTAIKTAIDNAQTAVNRTISLGADSGTASSQSLKDGNVAFNVKGKTGDYITTAMNGSTVEISTTRATIDSNATTGAASVTGADGLVTAKNVSDAINKAAEAAKSGAAWNLTTNSSTTDTTLVQGGDTVDLVNGDNIEISQDGTNKKKVTIKTKKDLTVDSIVANKSVTVGSGANQISLDGTTGAVSGNTFAGNSFTAGNSVLNTTGFHITGGPSVTATGIDAGNKAITNVASGGTTRSNAATVGDVQDAVANLSQNLNITDGTNNGTVDLKAQKLNVAGANGVTATVNNQTITVGLDTATKTAIDNAQTAVNRTISLGADSGTVSSQSLKDGNVAFNVKGKTGDYITTAMNGNTVEISTQQATLSNNATTGAATVTGNDGLVTAKNVADTINAVADKIKTSSAWKLTTNSSTTDVTDVKSGDTVDLVNGDNIEISQDGTNKKKVTIKTKKDLTVDSIVANKSVTVGSGANQISLDGTTGAVSGNTFAGNSFTAGNSVLNTTGFHITGGPSVTATGIDAGNKAITNVASGLGNDSNAATVGDVKGLVDGVGKNTFTLTADTTSTTAQALNKSGGLSFKVAGDGTLVSTSATGDTVTVSVSQGSLTNNTDGTVNANKAGVATTGDVATAVNTAVAKATGAQELTITDGTTDGTINLKNQKLNVAGANGVTATVNNQTITVGLNADTVNATTKGIGLTGDTGTTGNKYLKDGDVSFAVTGDSNLVSTKATAAGVQVSVDTSKIKDLAVGAVTVSKDATQTDNPITVSATTGTNAKDYAIGIDTAKLATKTDLTYRANNDTDANAKKVSLAKGLNFVNGTGTEATVGMNGTVSFGLDTATKTAIDNAQTAVNRTISLGADSGTVSSQSLKDGDVAFNVKGKTGDYITTAMNGSTVEIFTTRATINSNATTGAASVTGADGLVTAKNVSDAINKAAEAAKSGAAWNLTTNSSTTDTTLVQGGDTVDLVNGDNIEISQDGTNKKKVTIKTKKDLTVDSIVANKSVTVGSGANQISLDGTTGAVSGNTFAGNSFTAGNSVLNTTGFHITGGPSVTATGIDAGNKAITNVASGGTTRSNAATVGDVQDAVANLSQNLNITDGTNNGTVDLKTQKLNVAGANGVTATVNNQTITVGLDTNVVNATTKGIGLTGDTGATGNKYLKDGDVSFAVTGDSNLVSTKATAAGVQVSVDTSKIKDLAVGAVTVSKDATQTDNPITVSATTGTNAKDYAIGIDTAKLATKTDLTYRANNDTDANAKKVSLAKGLNFVNGTGTEATVGTDGKVSFGLDTATKTAIDNAQSAVNRTISLGADSGTVSSQSLKDGNVAFNVKGKTGDYITTAMNGSTVEISTTRATIDSNATTGAASVTGADGLVTAKNVSDAINKAAEAAKSGAAWNLTTNSSTTDTTLVQGGDTVDLVNGDNIEISQDGTNKKKVTIKTKKDLTVDSIVANKSVTVGSGANQISLDGTTGAVSGNTFAGNSFTAGNSVLNTTGFHITGGPSVTATGIDAGNKAITNVASGGTTRSNAATVGDVQDAVANSGWKVTVGTEGSGQSNVTGTSPEKIKTDEIVTFKAGNNMIVTQTGKAISYAVNPVLSGMTSATFTDPAGNTTTTNVNGITIAPVGGATSVSLTKDGLNNGGNKITNVAPGQGPTDAVNMSQLQGIGNSQVAAINQVAAEVQRVGAHAAAMAALKPIQYDPLEPTQFMAGVGNYRGQTAAAIGLAHYTNDNTMFNVGVSVGGNHNMVNAGVTHKFGYSPEKKNIPDRYKAGPISSIYVMQDEMTQLRSENEAYKAKLDKQQSEIDALKAAVDQLLASKA